MIGLNKNVKFEMREHSRKLIGILCMFLAALLTVFPGYKVRAEGTDQYTFPIQGYWDSSQGTEENPDVVYWRLDVIENTDNLELTIMSGKNGFDEVQLSEDRSYVTVAHDTGKKITSVVIMSGLDEIPDNCFANSSTSSVFDLTSVKLPTSVTKIGDSAFSGNSNLNTLYYPDTDDTEAGGTVGTCAIPDSVTSIGTGAFSGCGFEKVVFPSSLTAIPDSVFSYNEKLTNIDFVVTNTQIESIGSSAFLACKSLEGTIDLTGLTKLKTLGDSAFSGCSKIKAVNMPNNLEYLGDATFRGTGITGQISLPTGLKTLGNAYNGLSGVTGSVAIPSSVEKLLTGSTQSNDSIFGGTSISSLTVNGTNLSIREGAFTVMSGLTSVTIGSGVVEIRESAFEGDSNLSSVAMSDSSVKLIGQGAFYGCTALESIKLSDYLEYIGATYTQVSRGLGVFQGSGLKEITIPASIKYIGEHTFYNCESLTKVVIEAGDNDLMIGLPSSYSTDAAEIYGKVNWISGSGSSWTTDYTYIYSNGYKNTMGIDTSGQIEAFSNCPKLEEVWIPKNIAYIDSRSFAITPYAGSADDSKNPAYTKVYCYSGCAAELAESNDYNKNRNNYDIGVLYPVILDRPILPESVAAMLKESSQSRIKVKMGTPSDIVSKNKITFNENYTDKDNALSNLKYSSSDTSVFTVDDNGVITGNLSGGYTYREAELTITNGLTDASVTIGVAVEKDTSVKTVDMAYLEYSLLTEGDQAYVKKGTKYFMGKLLCDSSAQTLNGTLNEDRYYPMKGGSSLLPEGYDTLVEYTLTINNTLSTGNAVGYIYSHEAPDGYSAKDYKVVSVYPETATVSGELNGSKYINWNTTFPIDPNGNATVSFIVAYKKDGSQSSSGGDTTGGGTTSGGDTTGGGSTTGGDAGSGGATGGDSGSGGTTGGSDDTVPSVGTTEQDKSGTATYKVTETSKDSNGNTVVEVTYTAPTAAQKKKSTITVPATVTLADGTVAKVTEIAANAFKNNKKVTKLTIGKNVEKIGDGAFSGCTKLTTVSVGSKVTSIGNNAFAKCTSLTKITIPETVASIGKTAFNGDKKLKKITIKSKKLTSKNVSKNAFKGISTKTTIKVPKSKKKAYTTLFRKKGLSKKVKIK